MSHEVESERRSQSWRHFGAVLSEIEGLLVLTGLPAKVSNSTPTFQASSPEVEKSCRIFLKRFDAHRHYFMN